MGLVKRGGGGGITFDATMDDGEIGKKSGNQLTEITGESDVPYDDSVTHIGELVDGGIATEGQKAFEYVDDRLDALEGDDALPLTGITLSATASEAYLSDNPTGYNIQHFNTLSAGALYNGVQRDISFTLSIPAGNAANAGHLGSIYVILDGVQQSDSFDLASAFNVAERDGAQSYPPASSAGNTITVISCEKFGNTGYHQIWKGGIYVGGSFDLESSITHAGGVSTDFSLRGVYADPQDASWIVEIAEIGTGIGGSDRYRYSYDGGSTWNGNYDIVSGSWAGIGRSKEIKFDNLSGHTLGETWSWTNKSLSGEHSFALRHTYGATTQTSNTIVTFIDYFGLTNTPEIPVTGSNALYDPYWYSGSIGDKFRSGIGKWHYGSHAFGLAAEAYNIFNATFLEDIIAVDGSHMFCSDGTEIDGRYRIAYNDSHNTGASTPPKIYESVFYNNTDPAGLMNINVTGGARENAYFQLYALGTWSESAVFTQKGVCSGTESKDTTAGSDDFTLPTRWDGYNIEVLYRVEIDGVGTGPGGEDSFLVKRNGVIISSGNIIYPGTAIIDAAYNVTGASWGASTGHALGNYWEFYMVGTGLMIDTYDTITTGFDTQVGNRICDPMVDERWRIPAHVAQGITASGLNDFTTVPTPPPAYPTSPSWWDNTKLLADGEGFLHAGESATQKGLKFPGTTPMFDFGRQDDSGTPIHHPPIYNYALSPVHFVGTGLDDMGIGTSYVAVGTHTAAVTWKVEIDGIGTGPGGEDTFAWYKDGVLKGSNIPIPSLVSYNLVDLLGEHVHVEWLATTGHTLSDYWEFVGNLPNYRNFSGNQYYARVFYTPNSRGGGILKLEGLTLSDFQYGSGSRKADVHIKFPGTYAGPPSFLGGSGWLNLGRAYNVATFTGIDDDGCLVSSSGDEFTWSGGGYNTANCDGMVIVRITILDSTFGPLNSMQEKGSGW